jgi:lactoylglutathione lyase
MAISFATKERTMRMRTVLSTLAILLLSVCLASVRPAVAADEEFTKTAIDLGMVVQDVDKSVAFYTQAVGLNEMPGFQADGQFTGDAGLTDHHAVSVRVLVLGDGPAASRLKLIALPEAKPKRGDTQFIHSEFGFRYLTIGVKDMARAVARLEKAGVKPLGKCPIALPSAANRWICVVRDPDGNFVELVGPMPK